MKTLFHTVEEMESFAHDFAKKLSPGDIVALSGDLGAGKTTFVEKTAKALGYKNELVTSPTFVYLNIYSGNIPLYHFDLYRLKKSQEFLDMGFEEFLESKSFIFIEWPGRISSILPQNTIQIRIDKKEEFLRELSWNHL